VPETQIKAPLGFVVTAGSLGGLRQGTILAEDHLEANRVRHLVARGAIRPATQADVDAANAPLDPASSDEAAMTPTALVMAEREARQAEIARLEARIDELAALNDDNTALQNARVQESAMQATGTLPVVTEHSGAASTAENTPSSGQTEGGGSPSEPVDPAKQDAAEGAKPSTTTMRGRSS
jgi:hypothetical protein